jgi:hypothetical protein
LPYLSKTPAASPTAPPTSQLPANLPFQQPLLLSKALIKGEKINFFLDRVRPLECNAAGVFSFGPNLAAAGDPYGPRRANILQGEEEDAVAMARDVLGFVSAHAAAMFTHFLRALAASGREDAGRDPVLRPHMSRVREMAAALLLQRAGGAERDDEEKGRPEAAGFALDVVFQSHLVAGKAVAKPQWSLNQPHFQVWFRPADEDGLRAAGVTEEQLFSYAVAATHAVEKMMTSAQQPQTKNYRHAFARVNDVLQLGAKEKTI